MFHVKHYSVCTNWIHIYWIYIDACGDLASDSGRQTFPFKKAANTMFHVKHRICSFHYLKSSFTEFFHWIFFNNLIQRLQRLFCTGFDLWDNPYSNRRLRRFGAGFGLRSKHFPIRIRAQSPLRFGRLLCGPPDHPPRGAFISVRDWTLTEINLLLLITYRGESLLWLR